MGFHAFFYVDGHVADICMLPWMSRFERFAAIGNGDPKTEKIGSWGEKSRRFMVRAITRMRSLCERQVNMWVPSTLNAISDAGMRFLQTLLR